MESVILENGNEYAIINEIKDKKNHYVYMVNTKNDRDLCVRKCVKREEEEIFLGLDGDKELRYALKLLLERKI